MRIPAIGLLFVCMLAACASDPADDGDTSMSEQALSNNEQTAFNYFVSKGLTKAQAAGIVGNLIQESSVVPTAVQYGGGPGRGIAQWSVGGRWDSGTDSVVHYANARGLSRWALNTQLAFIWYELTNYGYGYASLRAATNVTDATVAFEVHYEICGACNQSGRIAYAKQVLAAYGGTSGGAGCYSGTLGTEMPDNACVQSKFDDLWYQCSNGSWVDRWSDPTACNGVHPL
jgi:Phage tail lysozyme